MKLIALGLLALQASLFKDIDLERASFNTFDGRGRLEPAYEGYSGSK